MHKPEGLVGLLIFSLIEERPRYGYEILKQLKSISGGYWEPGQGTVYGTLERLEGDGLIEEVEYRENGREERDRQYYGLTELGEERLAKYRSEYREKINPGDRILGLLHVYKFLAGENEFDKLMEKIEKEFLV